MKGAMKWDSGTVAISNLLSQETILHVFQMFQIKVN